jgi:hypothetical protein
VDGETVLADAVAAYREALGDRLVGAYALGSLAHGGFSPLVSDVDLALIVSDPILPGDAMTIEGVVETERAKGSDLHARLSVFWGSPSTLRGERSGGRFPALDRLDLLESGRLLAGSDDARRGLPRPSSRELFVAGAQFALEYLAGVGVRADVGGDALGSMRFAREDAIQEIRSPALLVDRGVRRVTKLVLFPVRFLYTAATGGVGTNDAAVDRYLDDREAPSKDLVAAARAWRTRTPFDEAGAIELLDQHMVPLYVHYVDHHIARLGALDRDDLAALFQDWRERLLV